MTRVSVSQTFASDPPTDTPRTTAVRRAFGLASRSSARRQNVLARTRLTIHPGQIIYLTGPSGSGKSVILRRLVRLLASKDRFATPAAIICPLSQGEATEAGTRSAPQAQTTRKASEGRATTSTPSQAHPTTSPTSQRHPTTSPPCKGGDTGGVLDPNRKRRRHEKRLSVCGCAQAGPKDAPQSLPLSEGEIKRGWQLYPLPHSQGQDTGEVLDPSRKRKRRGKRPKDAPILIDLADITIDHERAVVDCFTTPLNDTLRILASVGLADAYTFIRTPAQLSDGQKYRYRLARAVADKPRIIVADEFASTLDRTTARVIAARIRRIATRQGITFILATAHDDLYDDLQPDIYIEKHFHPRPHIRRTSQV